MLVILATEFDCTVEINDNDGRDSDNEALMCFLAGAGIREGEATQCVVEVEDGAGTTLRIHLDGSASAELMSLIRLVWSRER